MGRYYSGDIEGKFMFGVQDSDDASFFGGEQSEPSYINFFFSEDDTEEIEAGLKKCDEALGEHGAKIEAFFERTTGYTDGDIGVALGYPAPRDESKRTKREDGTVYLGWYDYTEPEKKIIAELLGWYARRDLGRKILACVKEKGECSFEAEI